MPNAQAQELPKDWTDPLELYGQYLPEVINREWIWSVKGQTCRSCWTRMVLNMFGSFDSGWLRSGSLLKAFELNRNRTPNPIYTLSSY